MGRYSITIGCPHCGGKSKKNGRRNNRQRYRCLVCKHSFIRQRSSPVSFKDFEGFYLLVIGDVNRKQLQRNRDVSRWTLSTRFKIFFNKPLFCNQVWEVLPPTRLSSPWVYGVDGKWLKRNGVFILHRNITTRENLYWSFHLSESYSALESDLVRLTGLIKESRSYPVGAVSDWKGAIVSSVACYLGDIPHQRCLTHVTRTLKASPTQKKSISLHSSA
ncbi:MAG: IS1 family transposase [Candidatus Pacebacteria bacterium]|nr:IS1 family transposase [Candidatus Paceibacterota bacterium]